MGINKSENKLYLYNCSRSSYELDNSNLLKYDATTTKSTKVKKYKFIKL